MADLKLDLDELENLHARLDRALAVVNHEFSMAAEVGPLVGDGGLESDIVHFSTQWNKHRLDIRDRLDWLKDSIKKIGTSFENMDTDLAKALAPPSHPAAAQPAHNPGGAQQV